MEYWRIAVEEAFDAEGVTATSAQVSAVAGWMQSAHECYHSGPPPEAPRETPPAPAKERVRAWWEDTSKLCGSDWILARQIHALINSR